LMVTKSRKVKLKSRNWSESGSDSRALNGLQVIS
jgi:hypothetical protein